MVLARDPISGTSPPDSNCRCTREPTIMGAIALLALPNVLGENPLMAPRVFVAKSLHQPTVALKQSRERATWPFDGELTC